MARQAKPIGLTIFDKKRHATKEEIEARQKAEDETCFGDWSFSVPDAVVNNVDAREEWGRLMDTVLKHKVKFITNAHIKMIEQYCMTYAEIARLTRVQYATIAECRGLGFSESQIQTILNNLDIESMLIRQRTLFIRYSRELLLTPAVAIQQASKRSKKKSGDSDEAEMFG